MCCGAHFTVALTSTGGVYVWGSGTHHRLGLGDDEDRLMPTMSPLRGQEVTQIAVCEDKVLAFAPIKIRKIVPDCCPLGGGTKLRVSGDGFFEVGCCGVCCGVVLSSGSMDFVAWISMDSMD